MRGVYGVTATNGETVILTVRLKERDLNEPITMSEESPSFLNTVEQAAVENGKLHVEVAAPHAPDKPVACDIPCKDKEPIVINNATLIRLADAALGIIGK